MACKGFKVLIAGGSIAGLTLANMLETLGIDYLVLEGYPEIAPQVGASIGLLPNGLRILDQIGCHDGIRALLDAPLKVGVVAGPDGKTLTTQIGVANHLEQRHGYNVIFVERQLVLQVLYDNLKDKSKVLVNKRVLKVTPISSGIKVTTKDGSSYTGDILVGADGIHSTVRQEMWRIADEIQPGYIPSSERTALPCDYKCIFGISKPTPGIDPLSTRSVFNDHFSYLILTGPGGRVYWFLFVSLGKTHYGPDIPEFTKKDEEQLAKEHWDDRITEAVTFGNIYANRTSSVLTALPEYVFKKWHFGRITTVGDSAHKFQPISGQGGNSAIETAAALINSLTEAMNAHPDGLSDADIKRVFEQTQALRTPRVRQLVSVAHDQQRLEGMETRLLKMVATLVVPNAGLDTVLKRWSDASISAVKLEMLDVPKRPRFVPYADELTSKPFGGTWISMAVVGAILGGLFYTAVDVLRLGPIDGPMTYIGAPLKSSYTGFTTVDSLLTLLVFSFSNAVSGPDPAQRLQAIYFLGMLAPIILIWTIEAYRRGNSRTVVSWATIWAAVYQVRGIGMISPLYYLVSIWTTGNTAYYRTSGRPVPEAVAKAVLPALCLGYIVPTILMFIPHGDATTAQNVVAFWQPAPIYVGILTWIIAALIKHVQGIESSDFEMYKGKDILALQNSYLFSFFAAAVTHIVSIVFISTTPSFSLADAFFNLPAPFTTWNISTITEEIFIFFRYDMLLCFTTILVWVLYSIYELRRLGYTTTAESLKVATAVIAGQVVVGPGATYAAAWYWRESILSQPVVVGGRKMVESRVD